MNNNRNNNRRRGRGNNRQQGGGQQLNRIDSRARGNAPQLLEKYRKLAHDAHLNGDRVQAEYFLQFADHYFRVIADQRLRQEEQRRPRDERFGEGGPEEETEDNEFHGDTDMSFEQTFGRRDEPREAREPREPRRDDAQRDAGQRDGGQREGAQREFRNRDDSGRDGNRDNNRDQPRNDRGPRREPQEDVQPREEIPAEEPAETASAFEPAGGNPFTRGNRVNRGGLRPRREREAPRGFEGEDGTAEASGFDPSLLPPAISETRDKVIANEEAAEAAPAPKRRGRPRKAVPETGGESLEAVNG